ncbi:MAG: hypothetical protein ABI612_00050 [Betaproteobacteria bacterium]
MGIQNLYANPAARWIAHGNFADGAIAAVDRFAFADEGSNRLKHDAREVVAAMLRERERFELTGGRRFQAAG